MESTDVSQSGGSKVIDVTERLKKISGALGEAKRLYSLGFAVHWIRPNSKVPVKPKWTGPTRDDWPEVENSYSANYGLGVRLGECSKLECGNYLANIDIDIKSSDRKHHTEAMAVVKKFFPTVLESAPIVKTGLGYRVFVKTSQPVPSGKLSSSPELVKVKLPGTPLTPRQESYIQLGKITAEELEAGFRIRNAWEVEFMSTGRQVLLPPTLHPETGRLYSWSRNIITADSVPLVSWAGAAHRKARGTDPDFSFKVKNLGDIALMDISPTIIDQIKDGKGVGDRSAALFSICLSLCRKGYDDDTILTILTDRDYYLGNTAYEHRQTDDRNSAARWIFDYGLKKARYEISAENAFGAAVVETKELTALEAELQKIELIDSVTDWKTKLKRTGQDGDGPPKATVTNVVLILENAVAPNLFVRDTFTYDDAYDTNPPWLGKKGDKLQDVDAIKIKVWLSETFRFEPPTPIINDAISHMLEHNSFDSAQDWLAGLPPWDGVLRLETWLAKHFQAEGETGYLAQIMRKWLVASVTRIRTPGAKFDWLPIFQGRQGVGKSMFGAILFGQSRFIDWLPNLMDKDAALNMRGKLCVEFGELSQFRRNELEAVKAFITRQVDHVRPPYGRREIDLHRRTVFIGTTNNERYLKDDTGNRRFLPVVVGRLDFDALYRDREQLWAEALAIVDNGFEESLYLDTEGTKIAEALQAERMIEDDSHAMEEELIEFFNTWENEPYDSRPFNLERFSSLDVFGIRESDASKAFSRAPLRRWTWNKTNQMNAGKALKRIGFERHRDVNRGSRRRNMLWVPVKSEE